MGARAQRSVSDNAEPEVETSQRGSGIGPRLVIGLCGALFLLSLGFYHFQQKRVWESRLSQAHSEREIALEELAKVKADFAASKQQSVDRTPSSFQVTLLKSHPAKLLEDLSITLIDLKFKREPARYTASVKLQYNDLPEMQLRDAEVGASVTYPGKTGYRITVVKTDPVSAQLEIAKVKE